MSCLTPIIVKNKASGEHQRVACTRCYHCRLKKISEWTFRVMQEEKISSSAHFLTLTYEDGKLPTSVSGKPTLRKKDVQLFIKRLRKRQAGNRKSTIRYVLCGEYGSRYGRPHYHMLLFNCQLELIDMAWRKGHVHYGTITTDSVAYAMKYMMKTKRDWKREDTRQREFMIMSKGIGKYYLNVQTIEYHKSNPIKNNSILVPNGARISLPRYYKERIYSPDEKQISAQFTLDKYMDETLKKFTRMSPKEFHRYHKQRIESVLAMELWRKKKSSSNSKVF